MRLFLKLSFFILVFFMFSCLKSLSANQAPDKVKLNDIEFNVNFDKEVGVPYCYIKYKGEEIGIINKDSGYEEINSVNTIVLNNSDYAFLYIYMMTKKGNGPCIIYSIDHEGNFRKVLNVWAVDWHDDGLLYDGGSLVLDSGDFDKDGIDDLRFKGRVILTDDKGEKIIDKYEVSLIFNWNEKNKGFKFNKKLSKGFERLTKDKGQLFRIEFLN